ncbi:hypothetical protein [Arenibacter troitsensis]|uniref:hypothetical protein n=1 Tax=Arenibacter troitsensis TaxID=188872 RepID=UPI000A1C9DB7|nr:hypothetical protein [Arenibacter troitsensis]
MKNIVYRNHDRYAIKRLLMEIGAHQLNKECELMKLPFPKRLGLFYIESSDDCVYLVYKYYVGTRKIMKLDRYELPEAGWERVSLE